MSERIYEQGPGGGVPTRINRGAGFADDTPLWTRVTRDGGGWHAWVVADNVADDEKNDPEGYVYCEQCGEPKS